MSLDDDARAELDRLTAEHLLRVPRVVDGGRGPRITIDGALVLDLGSNDYLGLGGDRRVVDAAKAAMDDGVGAGASRLIVGNHRRHVALESTLADWMRTPVRMFGSGYAANVGVLTTLLGPDDVVFSDELNHASIVDGCRLSRARIAVYPHRDLSALDVALAAQAGRRRIVVSETLFSMDGDMADVEALSRLCARHGAALMLDEAHAIGTWGPEGRGLAALANVVPDILVGTCGKALGAYGAFVATSRAIADLLWNRARSLVFSTALPPMISAAIDEAVEIVRGAEGDERRRALAARANLLRTRIHRAEGHAESAIIPVVIGDDRRVMEISARLFEQGVFAQGIRYPTVARGAARLRLSVSSIHEVADLESSSALIDEATR